MPLQPVNKKASAEINKIIDSTMEPNNINNINVPDMPVMNSKAGLYIHLNSLLVGRPMVDDSQLLSILHNRYQGDIQTTCIDLIVSSFDVLANAIFRNEKQPTTFVLRSFLINKVPLLVSTLFQTGFVATTAETCITEALSRIDTNAFPTFSSMFDDNGGDNMFADSVRQDFCFACCLHDLIAPESIERLLGEIPMQSLPTGGRYTKDVILHGCLANQDRIASFIEELENMDGNVGAVAVAITGVVQSLCESKDTGSLKTLCAHLARKPSALDAILLFERPVSILQPICRLLDEWRYDDDQSEYQPVYDEFGSIVLLVLVFVHRYDLNASDLGLTSASSFIQSLLNRSGMNQTLDQLTPEQSSQIGTWINALFSSSGTGLGDEPMAQCPPQSFYHLIPTLIHHIIMAFDHGRLSLETMKNGLEYLVDTFLLPSLVPALHWLANHIWAQKGDATACMAFLSIVMLPTSISSEASQMLSSILPLVATPLDSALRALQRKEPARTDIEPLLQILKPYLLWTRNGCVAHTEMESWCNAAHKGLMGSLTRLVRGLMSWSLNASGEGSMPTLYTHAQILFTVKMRGAKEVLDKILTTVAKETAAGNGSVAIDVATWLVMAPTQGGDTAEDKEQTQITLKEAMMFEVQDIGKLMKQDQAKAEALVRVYRRVQVLSTRNSSDQPMMGLQSGMDTGQLPQIMAMGSDLNMMGGLGDDGMMLDTSFVDAF